MITDSELMGLVSFGSHCDAYVGTRLLADRTIQNQGVSLVLVRWDLIKGSNEPNPGFLREGVG